MTRNWRFFLEMLKKNIFVVEPPHLKKNDWSSDTRSWVIAGFNAKILRKKNAHEMSLNFFADFQPDFIVKNSWYALLIQTKYLQFLEMRWLPATPLPHLCWSPSHMLHPWARWCQCCYWISASSRDHRRGCLQTAREKPWSHWCATERCGWSLGISLVVWLNIKSN